MWSIRMQYCLLLRQWRGQSLLVQPLTYWFVPKAARYGKKKNHIAIILKDIVNALQLTQFSFYFNAVLSPVSPLSRKGSMILIWIVSQYGMGLIYLIVVVPQMQWKCQTRMRKQTLLRYLLFPDVVWEFRCWDLLLPRP